VRNMLEILGILVAIGVFVFWCDVTDSWNNVFRWPRPEWTHAAQLWHTIRRGRRKNKPRSRK
jgi:hypothetical protein